MASKCIQCGCPSARPKSTDHESQDCLCQRCRRAAGGTNRRDRRAFSRLVQEEGGWEALAQFYATPLSRGGNGRQPSIGFQLERRQERPRLHAHGAARQLIEESRSIFLNNLTNLVTSVAIAHQFFKKADEDQDGTVTRAQFRCWVRKMVTADAYAGLDPDAEVAEVCARALGSSPELERRVARKLERAARQRGVGTTRDGEEPLFSAPPEAWVRGGCGSGSDSEDSLASGASSDAADSTGTLTPSSSSSSGGGGEDQVDPEAPVAFEDFKKAVDALSLKTLLRTDAVRVEIPVSEGPPHERLATVVAAPAGLVSLWGKEATEILRKSKVQQSWEEAYASGKNCIWVMPEADQDVRRVLEEAWFETEGLCLELGCGLGYDSVAFAEAGFEVVGVDISATAVCAARGLAKARGLEGRVRFLCGDAYELPRPSQPVALVWDNTLYQNAQRGDRHGSRWRYNSARYKELLLRVTVPGSLVMMNVMSSELTEGHVKLAERGFNLPLTSAMRLTMEFIEYFEFIFFRNGIYDLNSLFIHEATQLGYDKPAQLGGLPSWCVLMRRRQVPTPFVPRLPPEEPFLVASRILARDGFQQPPQPRFLKRLVEEEWGEQWGEGPTSGLMLTRNSEDSDREEVTELPDVPPALEEAPAEAGQHNNTSQLECPNARHMETSVVKAEETHWTTEGEEVRCFPSTMEGLAHVRSLGRCGNHTVQEWEGVD